MTVPPPVLRTNTTSSPRLFFADLSTAVTSSRRLDACDARTSPKNWSTKTCGLSLRSMRDAGTARGSRSPSHPGLMRGSASSFISLARLCAGSAFATAVTYLASASDRLAASLASLPPTPPPSLGSFSRMGFRLSSASSADFSPDFSPEESASTAATASAYSARSSASSTSSSNGKSSSDAASEASEASEASALSSSPLFFFFPSAARTASALIFLESDAISALSLASSLAHCCLAAVTASRSLAVSLPSTAAYLSAKAVLRLAASTASLPMTA